jgi:hypothetical protein
MNSNLSTQENCAATQSDAAVNSSSQMQPSAEVGIAASLSSLVDTFISNAVAPECNLPADNQNGNSDFCTSSKSEAVISQHCAATQSDAAVNSSSQMQPSAEVGIAASLSSLVDTFILNEPECPSLLSSSSSELNHGHPSAILNRNSNLHPLFISVPVMPRCERLQAQAKISELSKDDAGAVAAVKDMIGLAAAGESFRLALEIFFGAVETGINIDISFLCRDLLKMVTSFNQAEKLVLFFQAVIETELNCIQTGHHIPFRNLCGG